MANREARRPSFFSSFKSLGRSLIDLSRAFQGKGPLPDSGEGAPSIAERVVTSEPQLPLALHAPEVHFEDAQLLTQHTPGWHVPHPTHLPVPTYAPAMTAFGIVFIALGAVTVWPLSVIGAVIFVLAIAKWIGELLHD